MPKRHVACYIRISDDALKRGEGVDRQRADTTAVAERRYPNVDIIVYEDNDLSASKYSKKPRPAWISMCAAIERGDVVAVVAYHQDRMFRQPRELEAFITLCERVKLLNIHANGDHDLTNPDGQLVARINGAVSAKSSDDLSRRVKRAAADRQEKGEWLGGLVPYGYVGAPRTLTVDPAAAADIREAAAILCDGGSLRAILDRPGPPGRPKHRDGWRSLLLSPTMAGRTTAGNRANWEPILDAGTYQQCVTILTDPSRKTHSSKERQHWLTGILYCGLCNARLGPARKTLMRCTGCGRVSIKESVMDEQVRDALFGVNASVRDRERDEGGTNVPPPVDNSALLMELAADYASRRITRAEWDAARAVLVSVDSVASPRRRPPASLQTLWPDLDARGRHQYASLLLRRVLVAPADMRLPAPLRPVDRVTWEWAL